MLDSACREISDAHDAFLRRHIAERRRKAVIAALDSVLAELEELTLAGSRLAPAACRARVAALAAQVFGAEAPSGIPRSVSRLMEVVYAAQDAALIQRRRAALGLDRP
jgi:hypothetical protein